MENEGKKLNLTFLLQWLLVFVVNKGVEVAALSKCVQGLRYHKPHGGDITIQLERIQ